MRPQGHLAGGAIAGALLAASEQELNRAVLIAGTALAANLPDLDALLPPVAARLGIEEARLRRAMAVGEHDRHHAWVTHTPAPWAALTLGLALLARREGMPRQAKALVKMLAAGLAVHFAQDCTSEALPLLWPWRRKHYGLRLDGIGPVGFGEFMRRYPGTRAWRIEWATIILAALIVGAEALCER